jgi:SOS-response transcriptional repressor LexA
MEENKIKCPMCEGCGEIDKPHFKQKKMDFKTATAKRMKKQGFSIREIMVAMNYKSPRSVDKLIKGR